MQSGYRVAVVLIMMLGVSACSESAATTTTSAPAITVPDTTTSPATTAQATTTTPPPTTTSSTVAAGTVGDPAALQALAEQVAADSLIPIDEFFIPNITQPDPIEALKELLAYSDWMGENHPDKELTKIHTIEGSPANTAQQIFIDRFESFGYVVRAPSPFSNEDFEIVRADELPTTASIRNSVPDGSIAIRFVSNGGGYDVVKEDTGEVVETVAPWSNVVFYVVVAPTEFGWQEYWYGTL